MVPSSSGQDGALSRRRQGFDSPWDYQNRGVAQSGSAPALGAGCRRFESGHPDQFSFLRYLEFEGAIS